MTNSGYRGYPPKSFPPKKGFLKVQFGISPIDFKHNENEFDDFSREILLPHMQSRNGPNICVGDVNGDQREDFYVGGASGQAGRLYFQMTDGTFTSADQKVWSADKGSEEIQHIKNTNCTSISMQSYFTIELKI